MQKGAQSCQKMIFLFNIRVVSIIFSKFVLKINH